MKEGFSIAKESKALNPIQFNALAIILLVGFMPFAVAFISNAGSSADGNYVDSMKSGFQPSTGESKWLDNGGENWSWYYDNLNFYPNSDYEVDCSYVVDGICQGLDTPQENELGLSASFYGNQWRLPMTSQMIYQSHYSGSNGNNYVGSSGSDEYSWRFGSEYLSNVAENTTMDKIRFTFAEPLVSYSCSNAIFQNLTFQGSITFENQFERKTYSGFEYSTDNKYQYEQYNNNNGHFTEVCVVGFEVEFDFTGFESLELSEFVSGHWNETIIEVSLTNFENPDKIGNFGTTALPFSGDNFFFVGIEHQELDTVRAGFIIRSATLLLAFITFAIAVASTPYWDPFKNFFNGRF